MVGFRPDPELEQGLTDELKKTTTGLTVDQCHDLLRLTTLEKTFPNIADQFVSFLAQTRQDAITTLLSDLETRLIEAGLAPALMRPTTLFKGSFGQPPIIEKSGRTVGLEIIPIRTDVSLQLERTQLFGFTEVEGLSLVLTDVDTGSETEIPVPIGGKWQDVGETSLPLLAGHTYTLTYQENDLGDGNNAYNTVTQWPKSHNNCRNCVGPCISSFAKISGIGNGVTTRSSNFGLNIVLSAAGDVSGRLVDDPRRLLTALRHQIAVSFLSKIANSTRKNGETEDAIQAALFWLTEKDNTDRVPIKLDKALSSLVKALQAEASKALDVDHSDEITFTTV
jgi:hypothetical protein